MEIGVAAQEHIQEREHIEMQSPSTVTCFTPSVGSSRSEELRRSHFRKCLIEGMKEVAKIRDKLELLKECQEEQESKLELLKALKRGAPQNPSSMLPSGTFRRHTAAMRENCTS